MLSCNKPELTEIDLFRAERLLKTGNIAQGEVVKDLETAFSCLCKKNNASAYSSATSAFEAILKYLDIKPGDEIILSPLTFKSIPYSVLRTGATPIFIDTDSSYLPDWSLLSNLITDKTKLIVTTSLYGLPDNNLQIIKDSILNKKIWVVEDNAQAIGARYYSGDSVGSSEIIDFSIFSFYATKNITGCEGGIIVHNKDTEFFDLYKNNGIVQNYYNNLCIGTNLRMTDLNATIVLSQFDRLDQITQNRNKQANIYQEYLNIDNNQFKHIYGSTVHSFHQYTIQLPKKIKRNKLIQKLKNKNIHLGLYYDYLTNYDFELKNLGPFNDTPNALSQSRLCVSMPIGPAVSNLNIEYVAKIFNHFLKKEEA